jgi:prepilin-type N-terminal cleavage/methylation domain-containing protein
MRNHFKFQISNFKFGVPNSKAQIPNPKFPLNPEPRTLNPARSAFTLAELLIVITILTILSGLGLSAYTGAIELAREQRTRSQIDKIDALIMERWEGYRTRAVPIKIAAGTPPRLVAMMRLNALRDLMRMELPDRRTDVLSFPCDYHPAPTITLTISPPALWNSYRRRALKNLGSASSFARWTEQHQGSECLYLILSTIRDGDKAALDYFSADEIGDTDEDGMPEILDGWRTPIEFIRWPAGYVVEGLDSAYGVAFVDDDGNGVADDASEAGWIGSDDARVLTMQTKNFSLAPDPFDPVKVHAVPPGTPPPAPLTLFGTPFTPGYLLHPLIVSAGRDREFDIVFDNNPAPPFLQYSPSAANNFPNPYVFVNTIIGASPATVPVGTPADANSNGELDYFDNITNHDQTSQ